MLKGLEYIHSKNIVHADFKLANLLLHRPTPEEKAQGTLPCVKICDFGIAQIIEGDQRKALMREKCGSGGYIAPEIKHNNVEVVPEIDMWAFGICLYEMCVAYKPTMVNNYKYNSGEPIPFFVRDWRKLENKGEIVQDLIKKCLVIDPTKRLTASEAL